MTSTPIPNTDGDASRAITHLMSNTDVVVPIGNYWHIHTETSFDNVTTLAEPTMSGPTLCNVATDGEMAYTVHRIINATLGRVWNMYVCPTCADVLTSAIHSGDRPREFANLWHVAATAGDMCRYVVYNSDGLPMVVGADGESRYPADVIGADVPTDTDVPTDVATDVPTVFPETVPMGTGNVDAHRGTVALDALRYGHPARFPTDVTYRDLLAALNARCVDADTVIRNVSRTVRAYGRNQYHERNQYLDTYQRLIADGTLVSALWAYDVHTDDTVAIGSADGADVDRVMITQRPALRGTDVRNGATVWDIVRAYANVTADVDNDLTVLGESLDNASSDHGWCPVYDRLCSDLNEHLPAWTSAEFTRTDRDLDWLVDGSATLTLTVTVPWSTVVTARTSDDACDHVDSSNVSDSLDDLWYEIRRNGRLPDYVTISANDVDIDDYNVDNVDRYE